MSYTRAEVKGLVDGYAEFREIRDTTPGTGLRALIFLADLDCGIRALPPKEYQAILLHGLLRHTIRDASPLLGVSRSTLYERYDAGLTWLTDYLNGVAT